MSDFKKNIRSKITIQSWGLRTMAILASTFAVIDLLKQEYLLSLTLGFAWLLIFSVERRILKKSPHDDQRFL